MFLEACCTTAALREERKVLSQVVFSVKMSEHVRSQSDKCGLKACLASPPSVCLRAGHHPVHSVGIAASLSAVLLKLTDVRQRVQGTAEVCLPCLRIWLVFAWTISS